MSGDVQWTEIEVPRGAYIGWGETPGQHVTGRVLGYDDRGGTDFGGERCPQLQVELIERAASFDKAGARTDFEAGELVVLNCGQVSLKRAVRTANLEPGMLVKITMTGLVRVSNGTVKEFGIKVARGTAGQSPTPAPSPASMPANGQQSYTAPAAQPGAFASEPPF